MSLPYRQQRRLRHVGRVLRASDPHLAAMLSIFAGLAADECMPAREQLGLRRRGIRPLLARLCSLVARLCAGVAGTATAGLRRAIAGCRLTVRRARAWASGKQATRTTGRAARSSYRDLPTSRISDPRRPGHRPAE